MEASLPLDLRVILVGRTGLDAALRLDPGIELVRAQTPLEAIGEASAPMEGAQVCVVVVSPDVQRQFRGEANGTLDPAVPVAEFIRGLKIADPCVRVLRVEQEGSRSAGMLPGSDLFDAAVASDATPARVRELLREDTRPALSPALAGDRGPGVEPDASVDEMFTPRATPTLRATQRDVDTSDRQSDLVLVSLVLKGQDPSPAAVALIRERVGDCDIEFVPGEGAGDGTPVAWDRTAFGHLTSPRTPGASLMPHARWLAGWLRLRDQQSQLRRAAFTDSLTGAWNRRYFDRFLARVIEDARDKRQSVTVLVFDIDDFKKYNDRYGHDAGDEILRETVRLLRSVIRPSDRVCRIGGDEFAVIFFEPEGPRQEGSRHPSSVFMLAQRFQQQITGHRFPKLSDLAPGMLTISGGLATYPWDGATPEQLLCRADQLALASKRQGKNAITLGPGAMQ